MQCNCVITCISILDYFYLYKKMMPFDVLRVILWNLFHKITLPPIHGIKPHRFTLCTYGAYPLGTLGFFGGDIAQLSPISTEFSTALSMGILSL